MIKEPMFFGTQPKGGRNVRVALDTRCKKNPERPWEQPPFETALFYVRRQAMEVK